MMQLDDHGHPPPGRELDGAIWGILGCEVEWWWSYYVPSRVSLWENGWFTVTDTKTGLTDKQANFLDTWLQREVKAERMVRQPWHMVDGLLEIVPFISTTRAFFQVLEAKRREWVWQFSEHDTYLCALVWTTLPAGTFRSFWATVEWADYPDRIHAYAHVVCCCADLALKGEGDARA